MLHRSAPIRLLLAGLPVVLLLAACSSSTDSTGDTTPGTVGTVGTTNTGDTVGGGGWLDGEPAWNEVGDGAAGGDWADTDGAPMPAMSASDDAKTGSESAAGGMTAETTAADTDFVPPDDVGDPMPVDAGPLRAGSVDDNADFTAFLDYLDRIDELGVETRPFDPSGRIVVAITRPDGLPAAGVDVTVTSADGSTIATVRTTADGTARFLPHLYGDVLQDYTFTVAGSGASATGAPDGIVAMTVDAPDAAAAPVALDVLFLLDATGSMGDEIDRLKTTIDDVAGRIAALDTAPDVHFAMTLYRDLDDTFVTTTYDFTGDIDEFRAALDHVVAQGGGDYPEALDEGLAEALGAPSWRDPSSTVQLVFLVADAPPQVARQVAVPYVQSIVDAIGRGIKVFPIASSESDDQAEAVFRQIAAATGARFVFLSSGAAGAATGPSTDIASTDYEELALDDLIVRLVSEELAALTGVGPVETGPTTDPTTPPTNPEGQ